MAYGIVHHFPGGTKEQYEASLAAVHPSRDSLPKGQIFHAAGARTETEQKVEELVRFVHDAGRIPVQRDTLYNELRRWE